MRKKSRRTRQKELVGSAVGRIDGFFTADELHERISSEAKIGIATVYRSLKSLNRSGRLHCYVCGGRRIYSRDSNSHCHFVCRECGRTIHFGLRKIDFIRETGVGQPCHFQLDVHGVCSDCLRKRG